MAKQRFYVTTAIPYVNAAPHIGHALEFIQADVLARYHRQLGEEVFFLSGTDENALKNAQSAQEAGVPVKEFVKKNSQRFYALKDALNLSFDDFIFTTEERHIKGAQKLWQACEPNDIYKKSYRGLYCVGCEVFLTEKDLADGKCPDHGTAPEKVEEENYFFRLRRYEKPLKKLIEGGKLEIIPKERKNEVLAFINQGLEDFSISRLAERTRGWGIPVPEDSSQTIYVWFDALTNYITGLGYADEGNLFKKFWLENPNRVHVIGKGITRFHAIYWPAMLLSAKLPIPKTIFVHGYLTVEGKKISKTLGNIIDPFEMVKKYGADPLRYYLLAKFSPFGDGDFSEEKLKEAYNADLANGLGNLVARVAKLAERCGVKIRGYEDAKGDEFVEYHSAMEGIRLDKALEFIWGRISEADRYVNREKPWEKKGKALEKDLNYLITQLLNCSVLLQPFIPETAEKILRQFEGPKIKAGPPLFPRIK